MTPDETTPQLAQIGKQIAEAREATAQGQKTAAAAIGISAGTLVSAERGRRVRPSNLRKILDHYGLGFEQPERSHQAVLAAELVADFVDRAATAPARNEALGYILTCLNSHDTTGISDSDAQG